MKKSAVLKILNLVIAALVITQVSSAILRDFLPRSVFEVVHEGGGFVLVAGIILHAILNWNWIATTYLKKR